MVDGRLQWQMDLWRGWKMERSMRVQGEGEVPFYGRGRVRYPRPSQTFRLVNGRGEGFGPWHQGFRGAGRSAARA